METTRRYPPIGYRFCPTDEELLVYYLRNKILNLPLPCNVVKDVDLYKIHPSDLGESGEEVDGKYYVFTRTELKYPKGTLPNRVANKGSWKATTGITPVADERGNQVGVKRNLVFKMNSGDKKTNWHMQEYKIDHKKVDDWALCCIHEDFSADKKRKRNEKASTRIEVNLVNNNKRVNDSDGDHNQSPNKRKKGSERNGEEEEQDILYGALPYSLNLDRSLPYSTMQHDHQLLNETQLSDSWNVHKTAESANDNHHNHHQSPPNNSRNGNEWNGMECQVSSYERLSYLVNLAPLPNSTMQHELQLLNATQLCDSWNLDSMVEHAYDHDHNHNQSPLNRSQKGNELNTKEDKVNLYEGLLPYLVSPDPNVQHDHKFLNGTQFCDSWNVDKSTCKS